MINSDVNEARTHEAEVEANTKKKKNERRMACF
jgi:hypothetical protein